jgi:hypothetical protein
MKYRFFLGYISVAILLTSINCTTTPYIKVGQPWFRTLKDSEPFPLGAKIKIVVFGNTRPLLGNEELTADKLYASMAYLFKRRGYIIDEKTNDYLIQLNYRTERQDKFKLSSSYYSSNRNNIAFATNSVVGATSGLGVSVARAIGAISTRSTIAADFDASQAISYTHIVSLEIRNKSDKVIWKGESTWDSENLNLISRILPALQLIMSDLPADKNIKPTVNQVKETHAVNFYKLEIEGNWFTCPALPYRIWFEEPKYTRYNKNSMPNYINDSYALSAYLDLIQTAEFALPKGNANDWKNPINVNLWESVILGGQYLIGPGQRQINILIKLTGKSDGYYIDKCWVATDTEYEVYKQNFNRWQTALHEYYDVFEK